MKIILSTDFSEENQVLFPYAIDLMKVTGGTIILFHAYMDQILMGDSSFPGGIDSDTFFNRELLAEMEMQAEKLMLEKQLQLSKFIEEQAVIAIQIQTVLKGGDPEHELLELTNSENPDLILMGTRGKGGKAFLEGSMAKSLMSKVNVPLLAIPEQYHWRPGNDILYATNFSQFEVTTINQLIKLTEKYHPVIHVVHLIFDDKDQKATMLMEELQQAFSLQEKNQQMRFHLIRTNHATDALKLFVEQNQISLAAFIANKRTWLDYIFKDKVGKDAFFSLDIPLLTFKAID